MLDRNSVAMADLSARPHTTKEKDKDKDRDKAEDEETETSEGVAF
jgi:hypothetical protein